MPLQSGTSLSILVVILGLGINMALYPDVRDMVRGREVGSASAPNETASEPEEAFYPEKDEPRKTTNVPRPIPFESESKPTDPADRPPRLEPASEAEPPKPLPPPEPIRPIVEESPPPAEPETTVFPAIPGSSELPRKSEPPKIENPSELPSVFPTEAVEILPESSQAKPDPTSAFRPVVPSGLEEDYRRTAQGDVHQLEMFARSPLPSGSESATAPAYAGKHRPPERTPRQLPPGLPRWETIDMALERPVSTAP